MLIRYALPVVSLAMIAFAVVQMTKAQQQPAVSPPPVEPARSPYAAQLAGAGIVEPASENISVGTQLPGVVEQVFVRVGQSVKTGAPLFALDERQLRSELASKDAMRLSARASLAKLEAGTRPEEIPPAEAKVAEAAANLAEQKSLRDRYKQLTGSISVDELTRREAGYDTADAQLKKAQADLALLKAGSWSFDREIARANVRLAEAQVAQVQTDLDRLTVRAPRGRADESANPAESEFEVLQVNVRPGEFVGATAGQALVVLGKAGRPNVRVDIDENDIDRFTPGLVGVAKPRGTPTREYKLRFVRVEPYVIPKKSLTGGNVERVDTRVLQVIYALAGDGPKLYVGQQMDVFFDAAKRDASPNP